MESHVTRVHFRGILESRGRPTVEAEVALADGSLGLASAPVAIAPGRREQRRSWIRTLGPLDAVPEFARLRADIEGRRFASQAGFDAFLDELPAAGALGADVRLVLSVAFCRAGAAGRGLALPAYLAQLGDTRPSMPRPLVNVFSGGIHDATGRIPFQQIMVAPDLGSIAANVEAALAIFTAAEQRLRDAGRGFRYSESSGLLPDGADLAGILAALGEAIAQAGLPRSRVGLAIDVAAEHLRAPDGRYRLGNAVVDGSELLQRHLALVRSCNVVFLEDPFDPADVPLWRALTRELQATTCVVGDDLFATHSAHIEPGLATGIVLKPNQVGTLTGVLEAARAARAAQMALCVSHRSGETEDTLMCDLAVAVGAAFIKVGGPRRGDRTLKYNQLLRLGEWLSDPCPIPTKETCIEEDYANEAAATPS